MFQSVLFYTNKLKQLERFYMNVLQLEITDKGKNYFTVKIGTSKITFHHSEEAAFYHYAINIPGNQFSVIKYQLKQRIPLNRERGVDEVYFSSFDADSMYFEDPAGNIIELIGRRNRDMFGNPPFSEAFLNISEVGVVTPEIVKVSDELQDIGIPLRGVTIKPDSVNFLGYDDSFIVLVQPERKWYFSEQKSQTFPLEVMLTNKYQLLINSHGSLTIIEPESSSEDH